MTKGNRGEKKEKRDIITEGKRDKKERWREGDRRRERNRGKERREKEVDR